MIDNILRKVMSLNQLITLTNIVPPVDHIIKYVFDDLPNSKLNEFIKVMQVERAKQEKLIKRNEISTVFQEVPNKGKSEDLMDVYENYRSTHIRDDYDKRSESRSKG